MTDGRIRIGFGGSATNPSHLGHHLFLEMILQCKLFDLFHWYPSGWSKFKPSLLGGIFRQQMAIYAFPEKWVTKPLRGWASLLIDCSATMAEDIPTYLRFQMLRQDYPDADICFVTGSDALTVDPEKGGPMPIMNWQRADLLKNEKILFIPRKGFVLPGDLPLLPFPKWSWLDIAPLPDIQSKVLRQMIIDDDRQWRFMVNNDIMDFIDLHRERIVAEWKTLL